MLNWNSLKSIFANKLIPEAEIHRDLNIG